MRPILLLASLAAAASAQLNFTAPDLAKTLDFGDKTDSIYIEWAINDTSTYAPLNTNASLWFKGPGGEYRVKERINTGLGITGQKWETKEFRDEKQKHFNFTEGKVYFFELQFFREGGDVYAREKSGNYSLSGVAFGPIQGAGNMVRAGWMGAVVAAGMVGAMLML